MGASAEQFRFDLDGGTISLDFVNTVSGMRLKTPTERLEAWADLVYWAEQAGLLDPAQARERQSWARLHPAVTAREFRRAIELREALYEVVLAAIEKRPPEARALGEINEWIAEAHAHHRFDRELKKFVDLDAHTLAFLWPVALDAEELLEDELPTGRVRRCEESQVGGCGWLFLDETRNKSRRYCSMSDCGNRAKQRRFQQRHR